ncbi:MAG: FtsX-like permease family protein [Gammaproteobacteria bacterium]|nr:FtsX-like permease family protein [Gammaproteobacteria bacterium]
MKYFYLVWKSLWRKKIRTTLTILSVFVAFLLFGLLNALNQAFGGATDLANAQRLITLDKISIINSLPAAYLQRIESIPGVNRVAHASWFGGYYQEPRNQFAQFPVDPERYLDVYPELSIPDEQREDWMRRRDTIIVGRGLIEQFGWAIGDRIPIYSSIWTNKSGSQVWDFEIAGIFDNDDPRSNTLFMLIHYDYFDEGRAFGQGSMGWFILNIDDDANAAEVANAVDTQFANSPNQTKTSTEAAFAESFIGQYGNIALIVSLILGAVFFTILLVAGNTMAQSVRERISELAVLKTLGFEDKSVMGIVLAESSLVMLFGGLMGLGTAALLVNVLLAGSIPLPGVYIDAQALLMGLLYMVLAGIAAGLFPALRAMRLTIVDALARA